MEKVELTTGPWIVECVPQDGARINRLQYDGVDLLTTAPASFLRPKQDYGRYETRPVYGYDDCFPTVDACDYPARDKLALPDHGELCWLGWEVAVGENRLDCSARSSLLPVIFKRTMVFEGNLLSWKFEVENTGNGEVPFLHVMHALMPLGEIAEIELPDFNVVFDEMNNRSVNFDSPKQLTRHLLGLKTGQAAMLLLRNVRCPEAKIKLKSGLTVAIEFPVELFPTFGIWWNNGGYPDEEGCHRVECAFEPMPGSLSSLAKSYEKGACLKVPSHGRFTWTINWRITSE